jgi:DNA repair protein RecO (recombination protein O)
MQMRDAGIVISVRKFSEHSATIRILTAQHGLYGGMARGAFAKSQRGIYQSGNIVSVHWQARLAEHMGTLQCELVRPSAALIMNHPFRLAGLNSLCTLVELLLPERDPQPVLYPMVEVLVELLAGDAPDAVWLEYYLRFEVELLSSSGFGLDLSACAASGATENLVYVSPKSGRAVSQAAGEPYHDKMLPLPSFLLENTGSAPVPAQQTIDAAALTRYFLEGWALAPRGLKLPAARQRLEQMIMDYGQNDQRTA